MEGRVARLHWAVGRCGEAFTLDHFRKGGFAFITDHPGPKVAPEVALVGKGHGADARGHIDQRHPHGDGVICVERPIGLVLVPRRMPAARLLGQGLVMIEAHAWRPQQFGRNPGEAGGEHEGLDRRVPHPEIMPLEKGLEIGCSLFQRRRLCRQSPLLSQDRRRKRGDFFGAGQAAHHGVTVSAKTFDGRIIQLERRVDP